MSSIDVLHLCLVLPLAIPAVLWPIFAWFSRGLEGRTRTRTERLGRCAALYTVLALAALGYVMAVLTWYTIVHPSSSREHKLAMITSLLLTGEAKPIYAPPAIAQWEAKASILELLVAPLRLAYLALTTATAIVVLVPLSDLLFSGRRGRRGFGVEPPAGPAGRQAGDFSSDDTERSTCPTCGKTVPSDSEFSI